MNIILLGAPASGKGTQSEMLAKRFNLYLLQTGNLSRELAQKNPRIKEIMESVLDGRLPAGSHVPITVVPKAGPNWGEMIPLKGERT